MNPSAYADPNPTLQTITANTAFDLGQMKDTEIGENTSVCDYGGMTYYSAGELILIFDGGHSATQTDALYYFDLQRLSWFAFYPQYYFTLGV